MKALAMVLVLVAVQAQAEKFYSKAVGGAPFWGIIPVESEAGVTAASPTAALKPVPRRIAPGELAKRIPDEFPVLYFENNQAKLDAVQIQAIRGLAKHLKDTPTARAKIEGFTDATGSAPLNRDLGARRAKAVFDILVEEGVPPQRLSVLNHGGNPEERKATVSITN